jgi:hypothetical protein
MPKQKVFQLTFMVNEEKLQEIYSHAPVTSALIAAAVVCLEDDGIILKEIKDVTSDQGMK